MKRGCFPARKAKGRNPEKGKTEPAGGRRGAPVNHARRGAPVNSARCPPHRSSSKKEFYNEAPSHAVGGRVHGAKCLAVLAGVA